MGAENCVTSCDLLIFMDQSAEPITTPNPSRAGHAAGYQDLIGRPLVQGAMGVEVIDILGQHLLQVTLVHDEYPIRTLATHTAYPSLSDRVRLNRSGPASTSRSAKTEALREGITCTNRCNPYPIRDRPTAPG